MQLANHLLQGDISIHWKLATGLETFEYAFPHTAYWIWKSVYVGSRCVRFNLSMSSADAAIMTAG